MVSEPEREARSDQGQVHFACVASTHQDRTHRLRPEEDDWDQILGIQRQHNSGMPGQAGKPQEVVKSSESKLGQGCIGGYRTMHRPMQRPAGGMASRRS